MQGKLVTIAYTKELLFMEIQEERRLLERSGTDSELLAIADKVFAGGRITPAEATLLYKKGELPFLSVLADFVRRRINGDNVYFHITTLYLILQCFL